MTPLCLATLLALAAGAPPEAPPARTPSAPARVAAAAPSAQVLPPAQALAPASGVAPVSAVAPVAALATPDPAAPAPAPVAPAPAPAAAAGGSAASVAQPGPYSAPAEGPDVELHVPKAEIQKLSLDVENLQARLDVDTSVAQLVTIRAGVVATVQKLKAELDGVTAETHLVVRLNRVADVLNRALAAIEDKPQLAGGPVAAAQGGTTLPTAGVAVDASAEPHPAPAPKPPTE